MLIFKDTLSFFAFRFDNDLRAMMPPCRYASFTMLAAAVFSGAEFIFFASALPSPFFAQLA